MERVGIFDALILTIFRTITLQKYYRTNIRKFWLKNYYEKPSNSHGEYKAVCYKQRRPTLIECRPWVICVMDPGHDTSYLSKYQMQDMPPGDINPFPCLPYTTHHKNGCK